MVVLEYGRRAQHLQTRQTAIVLYYSSVTVQAQYRGQTQMAA